MITAITTFQFHIHLPICYTPTDSRNTFFSIVQFKFVMVDGIFVMAIFVFNTHISNFNMLIDFTLLRFYRQSVRYVLSFGLSYLWNIYGLNFDFVSASFYFVSTSIHAKHHTNTHVIYFSMLLTFFFIFFIFLYSYHTNCKYEIQKVFFSAVVYLYACTRTVFLHIRHVTFKPGHIIISSWLISHHINEHTIFLDVLDKTNGTRCSDSSIYWPKTLRCTKNKNDFRFCISYSVTMQNKHVITEKSSADVMGP